MKAQFYIPEGFRPMEFLVFSDEGRLWLIKCTEFLIIRSGDEGGRVHGTTLRAGCGMALIEVG